MKRILLTGFEAFGAQSINPSELLVQRLATDFSFLTTRILSVQFAKAFAELKEIVVSEGPFDLIVMLGQAGGREKISLERFAHNWMELAVADRKNPVVPAGKIDALAPLAVMTTLDVESLRDRLNTKFKEMPVAASLSAGKYVCNHLYFNVLNQLSSQNIPALFVHVPFLPEQTSDSSVPSMEFDRQIAVIRELLLVLMLMDRTDFA